MFIFIPYSFLPAARGKLILGRNIRAGNCSAWALNLRSPASPLAAETTFVIFRWPGRARGIHCARDGTGLLRHPITPLTTRSTRSIRRQLNQAVAVWSALSSISPRRPSDVDFQKPHTYGKNNPENDPRLFARRPLSEIW